MIDENKLLEWLQDEYDESKHEGEKCMPYGVDYQYLYGKIDLIQDILIEIKQGRFNENQTKDV